MHGHAAPGFEGLEASFARALERSHGRGGALHVRVAGRVVADLWGGEARPGQPWLADTPTVVFSCTKGIVAILAGELVREGRLDLDAPVSAYWPEFAAAGKSEIPVRWLLAHRAGLPAVRHDVSLEDALDWDRIVGMLADEAPLFPPGKTHLYHALTYGWLVGEVIRRVSGKGVGDFLAERIAAPLGVDAWIGTPPSELGRVAQLFSETSAFPALPDFGPSELAMLGDRPMTLGAAFPAEIALEDAGFNSDLVRAAVVPGAGGVASARALATIWSATVTDSEAVRLLNDEVIADMSPVQSEGEPALPFPGPWPRWGTGFMLNSEVRPFLTDASFGHDGAGGQVAFADPTHQVGFAYVTNDLQMAGDDRGVELVQVLRRALAVD